MESEHVPVPRAEVAAPAAAPALGGAVPLGPVSTCDTTHVKFGKDVLSASVKRDGELVKSEGGIRLNNGESHSLKLSWAEAFGSAANLQPGTVLKVELYVTENSWEAGHGFMSPYNGTSPQLTPRDGRYKVSVSL